MANPAKAQLTSGQGAAAIIAGVIGHFLFSVAWAGLFISIGFLLFRGLITGLLNQFLGSATLEGEAGDAVSGWIRALEGILNTLSVVFIVLAVLGLLFAFFISWLILKIGKVRKPGGATISSFVIVAIIDGGLLLAALAIGGVFARNTDSGAPIVIVWFVLTAVVGALIWLWMVWIRRGPAPEAVAAGAPAGVASGTGATPAAVPPAPAPVLDPSADPASDAPVVDPVAPPAGSEPAQGTSTARKPATKSPTADEPPAT